MKKTDNGLKPLVEQMQEVMGNTRVRYADAVVAYLAKPENGQRIVTKNQVYQLVSDFAPLTLDNMYIAKAIKAVVSEFEEKKNDFDREKAELTV